MVPSLSVHVAAASVKATVRCPHWVACLAKKHRQAGTTKGTSHAEETGFGRSPVLQAGNEGPV